MMQTDSRASAWEQYWFRPCQTHRLTVTRVGLAAVAFCFFLSHLADAGWWFAADGILDPETTSVLMGAGSDGSVASYRFSPLYLVGSSTAIRVVLGLFALLALVSAMTASRLAVGLLYLAVLSVLHRGPMLAGLLEIPLCFGLLYLIIEPGEPLIRRLHRIASRSWTATLAGRLIGLHTAALLLMTVATQLAAEVWWNGEAVAYLSLDAASQPFDLGSLFANPLAASFATHLVLLTPVVGLGLWFFSAAPRAGKRLLYAYLLVVVVLTGELLYPLSLMVLIAGGLPTDGHAQNDGPVSEKHP